MEPRITFRNFPPSEAIKVVVGQKLQRLSKFYHDIIDCHVVIEAPHRHQHQGKLYHVQIRLTVPGQEIVVQRDPSAHQAHQDIYVAIRDAFKSIRRQLEDYARKQRGQVKVHAFS